MKWNKNQVQKSKYNKSTNKKLYRTPHEVGFIVYRKERITIENFNSF